MKKFFAYAALLGFVLFAWYSWRLIWGRPVSINHFADRAALERVYRNPEAMTLLGLLENTPLDRFSHRLTDVSQPGESEILSLLQTHYHTFKQYDRAALSGQQRLTYDYLDFLWGTAVEASAYPWHYDNGFYVGPYPVNQLGGLQVLPLSVMAEMQQVVDESSAANYLARLGALAPYLDDLQGALQRRAAAGAVPPRHIVEMLVRSVEVLRDLPAEEWGVYRALKRNLANNGVADAPSKTLLDTAMATLNETVRPAYGRLGDTLRTLAGVAPEAVGIWQLPQGDNYYRTLLRLFTTSQRSPEEIHQLGLERVAALQAEMSARLTDLGFGGDSIAEQIASMSAGPDTYYSDKPDLDALVLADYTAMERRLQSGTREAFHEMPGQALEVRAAPPEEEEGPGAYYMPPSLGGDRPGVFYVNLRQPTEIQRFGMLTLAAHEGVPGHHFEVAYSQNLKGIPMLRANAPITAYSEGWALYSERLVYELGLHDETSNIGRLQAEMFRAVRLVVDTGIHAKRWSRQKAIDYMMAYTGMPEGEVTAEIDRYIVMPGQACAYMVGMLEMLALREEARERLGDAFQLADFHQALLKNGPLPLDILRREVEASLR